MFAELRPEERKECLFWLPLLIEPYQNFVKHIYEFIESLIEDPDAFIATFPFEDLLIIALESHSEYWTSLALDWLVHF